MALASASAFAFASCSPPPPSPPPPLVSPLRLLLLHLSISPSPAVMTAAWQRQDSMSGRFNAAAQVQQHPPPPPLPRSRPATPVCPQPPSLPRSFPHCSCDNSRLILLLVETAERSSHSPCPSNCALPACGVMRDCKAEQRQCSTALAKPQRQLQPPNMHASAALQLYLKPAAEQPALASRTVYPFVPGIVSVSSGTPGVLSPALLDMHW